MLAIICLPRQFHAGVVENNDLQHLRTARWALPTYLGLFALFVLPNVAAGMITQPGSSPVSYTHSPAHSTPEHLLCLLPLE